MDSRFAVAQRYLIVALVFFAVLAIFPLTQEVTDVKTLGYELCAFAALALWLFSPQHAQGPLWRSSALLPLFIAFLGLNLAAVFISPNMGYSLFREFIKLAALFILFVVAADVYHTPKQVWGLIGAICIAVSIASLYGFVQRMGIDPFPWGEDEGLLRRAPATFGNPNFASHTLTLTIILAGGLCTQRKGRWALLCIPLFLCHFAFTQTRGSLLALAGALILVLVALVVSRKVKNPSRAIATTLSTVLLAGMIGMAAVATITNVKTGQPYPFDKGESITLRYHSFYGACRMIQDAPWLGHGPGMYQVVNPEYWTPLERERFSSLNKRNFHVHNEPLEIAVDAGLPAAIVYIAILILGLYYGLSLWFASNDSERRSLGLALAAFFLAFLLDGFFGFNLHVPVSAVLLFLVAGATVGVWRESKTPSVRRAFQYGWFPLSWRLVALGCAAIIPILGIRDFSAQFLHQRGLGATHYKAYAAAAQCFHKAALLAPYDWLHPFRLGETEVTTGNLDEAAKHFARTLELNPNHVYAMFEMAQAMFNIAVSSPGDKAQAPLNEAVNYAERAAQFNPLFPEVHDLLGRASFRRARLLTDSSPGETPEAVEKAWREAEQHLLEAIECGSKDKYKLYQLIAFARLARGDVLGAQKALIHSLEDKPGEMETWQLFLQSSQKTGKYDSIRTSLDRHIENLKWSRSAPSDELGALYLLRAKVLYAGYGDKSGAEEAFLRAVEKCPGRADAWAAFRAFAKSVGREETFKAALLQATAGQEKAR